MDTLELNRNQLELIQNPIFGLTLALYQEANTPSEVAKKLNEPANKIHYRTEKLYELGLLEITEQKGRSKKYQAVAKNFNVPKSLEAEMGQAMLASIGEMIDKLKKGLLASMNTGINKYLSDPNSNQPAGFWLGEELPKANKKTFEPLIQIGEFKLSASDYDDFNADILEVLERYRTKDNDVDDIAAGIISVGFIAFRKNG